MKFLTLSNKMNLVLLGSLIYKEGQKCVLDRLAFGTKDMVVYIVGEELNREYAKSVVNGDDNMRLEAQTLNALRGRSSVNLVAKHASEFRLPEHSRDMDTIFVYYRGNNSTGIDSYFDVMCLANDFPRMYPSSRRRYVVTDRSDMTDYSSRGIEDFREPSDLFSRAGEISPKDDELLGLVRQLTQAVIEWLRSGFSRDRTSDAYRAPVNVYNEILVSGVSSTPRPNWVLNVETPAIKGLEASTGLMYRDTAVENAISFTDGVNSQSLMLHSGESRAKVTFEAIKLLKVYAVKNGLVREDSDFFAIETWQTLEGKSGS